MPPRRTDREDACAAVRIGSGAPGRERTTGKIRRGERPTSAASGTAVLRAFRRVQSSGPARPKSAQGNTAVSSTLAVHRRLSRGSPRGAARREARLARSVCQRAGVRSGGGAPLSGMRTAEPLRRRRASGPGMPRRAPQAMAATACDPPRSTALGARDSRAHGLRAHALRSARSRPPRSKPYVSLFGDRPPCGAPRAARSAFRAFLAAPPDCAQDAVSGPRDPGPTPPRPSVNALRLYGTWGGAGRGPAQATPEIRAQKRSPAASQRGRSWRAR